MSEVVFYRVPGIMNKRLSVWAADCEECGRQVRLGPGSKAMCRRIVAHVGGRVLCGEHWTAAQPTATEDGEQSGGGL